ncbi:MAG TPA: DUF2341 domain-containing protein [Polyangia bacterium]|nr:DUF2341 domain-containing protein [Polyangia bacterium]
MNSLDAGHEQRQPDSDDVGAPANADASLDAALMDARASDGASGAAWWNPMFSRRRLLAFDARLAASTPGQSDFPVALKIPANTIDPAAAGVAGADVRFVDASGKVLARDIESWDAQGAAIVWLKLPTLPVDSAAPLYMYYGAAGSPPPAGDRQAVWPTPYAAVWHFAGKADDATMNHFDGAAVQAAFDAGKLGQAAKFSGAAHDHIGLARGAAIISGAQAVTESAWVKTGTIDKGSFGAVLAIGTADKTGDLGRTQLYVWGSSASYPFGGQPLRNALYGEINPDEVPSGWDFVASPVDAIQPGQWHYITVVFDAKGKSTSVYVDGALVAGPLETPGHGGGAPRAGNWTHTSFPTTPTDRVVIGALEDLSHGYFDGLIDELRVETVARSASWIAAQAIAVTGDAITLGPEEHAP